MRFGFGLDVGFDFFTIPARILAPAMDARQPQKHPKKIRPRALTEMM
jgi:hypothetical protein